MVVPFKWALVKSPVLLVWDPFGTVLGQFRVSSWWCLVVVWASFGAPCVAETLSPAGRRDIRTNVDFLMFCCTLCRPRVFSFAQH